MKKIRNIIMAIALLIGVLLVGYISGRRHSRGDVKIVSDTLILRDTHVIKEPVLVERTSKDTLLVAVRDTTRIHDTIYVALPTETRIYRGEEYYAEVSGYKPSLDCIEVYPRTVTISKMETITQKPSKWHYGIDVGLKYRSAVDKYVVPGIGAKLGYKRVTFRAEFGAAVKTKERTFISYEPYMEFGLKYDLVTQ